MVARFVVLAALIVVAGIRQAAAQQHPRRTDRRRVGFEDAADDNTVLGPYRSSPNSSALRLDKPQTN
jgi:hypothetical protein